jgi:hypothetical protein
MGNRSIGDEVIRASREVGYLTSALKALTWAVRETLNSDAAKAVHGFDSMPVEMEAPIDVKSYPFVQVMYRNKSFTPDYNVGGDAFTDSRESPASSGRLREYEFSGTCTVNVYSTSIWERERISDCIIGALGASIEFRDKLVSNEWINMSPNMATLASASANESWGTPWDADLMTAFRTFTFEVQGQFYYATYPTLEYITKVDVESRMRA